MTLLLAVRGFRNQDDLPIQAVVQGHRRLGAATLAVTAALVLLGLAPSAGTAGNGPRVSVISDSIMTAVTWGNDPAMAALSQGLDLQIDAAVCRRLNGQSCEFNNAYAPTTLSVINGWASQLGSIVVIVDGYNDLPDQFPADVELTLDTLRNDGVQRVLWVNLHEVRPEYAAKNAVLAAAARRHPELRVLDWNAYSSPHPDWYQTDYIHLRPAGGVAIATWLRQAIANAFVPVAPPDPALVVDPTQKLLLRLGHHVERALRGGGGTAPLHWSTTDATLEQTGLHLLANGSLVGRPKHAGIFDVPLKLTDADGSTAGVRVTLVVKPR
jgi:hypothetical protein